MVETVTRRLAFMALLAAALMAAPGPERAAALEADILAADYPVYLFARSLLAGRPDRRVELLAGAAGCPHDYVLTPKELERLSQAEVLIVGGLGLDSFLERALGVAKPGLKIIDASGGLAPAGGRAAPLILHSQESAAAWYRGPRPEADPHLFASLSGAIVMTDRLAEGLAGLDPLEAEAYRSGAAEINARYQELLEKYRAAGAKLRRPKVILSHGVLSYLAADLGLAAVAVIEGEEEEPVSAARLSELAALAGREGVRAILADPDGRLDLARIVGAEARLPVAIVDPATSGPDEPPDDYFLKVFQTNLEVLENLFSPQSLQEEPPADLDPGQPQPGRGETGRR